MLMIDCGDDGDGDDDDGDFDGDWWWWWWWWCWLTVVCDYGAGAGAGAGAGDDDDDVDDRDDDEYLASQVNQLVDCQTNSTASELPWLIMLAMIIIMDRTGWWRYGEDAIFIQ